MLAYDLRALQEEFSDGATTIVKREIAERFSDCLSFSDLSSLTNKVVKVVLESLDETTTMDASERMVKVAASTSTVLVDFLSECSFTKDTTDIGSALSYIPTFRSRVASNMTILLDRLRKAYLSGERGPAPASKLLKKTKPLYEFVRLTLGIRMHGSENYNLFANGHGFDEVTTGQSVSLIHEVCCSVLDYDLRLLIWIIGYP